MDSKLKAPMHAFGALSYARTGNLGDEIQSLAAMTLLPSVDHLFDRENLHQAAHDFDYDVSVIMNGWFLHYPENWPPSPRIRPLLVSMHITQMRSQSGLVASEVLLTPPLSHYLKSYGPVGARDTATLKLLQDAGIEAYFSGCLTLTLNRPPVHCAEDLVVINDIPKPVAAHIRLHTKKRLFTATQVDIDEANTTERFNRAQELLDLYARASCVVTGRLHCALPCLAMGTPVLLIDKAADQYRFSGLNEFLHHCRPEELLSGTFPYKVDQPPPNKTEHLPYRDEMIRRVRAFVDSVVSGDLPPRLPHPTMQVCWKDIEYFDDSMRQRVEQMAAYIPANATVMDLGCGERTLSRMIGSATYVGVDYRSRGENTVVCDFNKRQFPDLRCDVAFVSGCLEYVTDHRWFIGQICDKVAMCVLSYCTLESFPDRLNRRRLGWVNDLTSHHIKQEFAKNRFHLSAEDITPTQNAIFVFQRSVATLECPWIEANAASAHHQPETNIAPGTFHATLDSSQEQVFCSLYAAARSKEQLGLPEQEVIDAYLEASHAMPTRAEALYGAIRFCCSKGRYEEGFKLANQGLAIVRPSEGMSIESWIYDYGLLDELAVCAYWSGHYRESLNACIAILASAACPADQRERIAANARFALEKLPNQRNLGWLDAAGGFIEQHALAPPRHLRSRMVGTPRVLVAILDTRKEPSLSLYLECIEALDYPKSSIVLYISTHLNADRTEAILRDWVARVGHLYSGVEFAAENVDEPVQRFSAHESNEACLRVLGRLRNISLTRALELDCEFYFTAELDNFIRPCTLRELLALNLPIVAPFLRSIDAGAFFSNYHAEIDENGYYRGCDQYLWILNRWVRGAIELPVVQSTYLLRADVLKDLTYDDTTNRHAYVVFSDSARRAGISQYIDNRQVYGYINMEDGDEMRVARAIEHASALLRSELDAQSGSQCLLASVG